MINTVAQNLFELLSDDYGDNDRLLEFCEYSCDHIDQQVTSDRYRRVGTDFASSNIHFYMTGYEGGWCDFQHYRKVNVEAQRIYETVIIACRMTYPSSVKPYA